MPFRELEHTADVLIRVTAPTLEALFSEAARALQTVMFTGGEDHGILQSFTLRSDSYESLLHDFLSELLFISEVEAIVFSTVQVEFEDTALHAVARGEPFDPDRHLGGTEVKGISYSGLAIRRDEQNYVVDILFDV